MANRHVWLRVKTKELAKKVASFLIEDDWHYNLANVSGHGYEWTAKLIANSYQLAIALRSAGFSVHMSGNNIMVTGG